MNPILIIGLGNPGPKYDNTRHNAGFLVVDALAERLGLSWKKKRLMKVEMIETRVGDRKVILAKPQTYMNLSGRAAAALMKKFRVALEDVWVVYDDVDLDLGTLRVRVGGSAGGHNGIKSLLSSLPSDQFVRFRVGVGAAPDRMPLENWVLSRFRDSERSDIDSVIQTTVEKIETALERGVETVTVKK